MYVRTYDYIYTVITLYGEGSSDRLERDRGIECSSNYSTPHMNVQGLKYEHIKLQRIHGSQIVTTIILLAIKH